MCRQLRPVDTLSVSPTACIGRLRQLARGDFDPAAVPLCLGERQTLHHVESLAQSYISSAPARHGALRITPAMAAGVSDHVWDIEDIVGLLDEASKKAA